MGNSSEYNRQYYLDNLKRIKLNEQTPRRRELRRKRLIKSKYELSYKEWENLWKAQNKRCAICGEIISEEKDICVDHNHKTGAIRGLLCKKCNLGLGCFRDNPELMKLVIKYLKNDIATSR